MTARPSAGLGRSTTGWIQTLLHRRRGVRWIAAAGASVAAFMALGADRSGEPAIEQTVAVAPTPGPADRLAPATRGVPIPVDSAAFKVGDVVDIHEIRTGAAVARDALVVQAGDGDAVVAVPLERVHAVVDALTTGGVILVLVPRAPLEDPVPASPSPS